MKSGSFTGLTSSKTSTVHSSPGGHAGPWPVLRQRAMLTDVCLPYNHLTPTGSPRHLLGAGDHVDVRGLCCWQKLWRRPGSMLALAVKGKEVPLAVYE